MATTKIGNFRDNPCYYVNCADAGRVALLAGPFITHQEAIDLLDKVRDLAHEVDGRAWFYAYGTCKTENGKRIGLLNQKLGL